METRGTGEDGEERTRRPLQRWRAGGFEEVSPKGWAEPAHTPVNQRNDREIFVQRVCGRTDRIHRPGRLSAEAVSAGPHDRDGATTPSSSLTAPAIRRLQADCLSLRAHEPNPAGPAVHQDLAGEHICDIFLQVRLQRRLAEAELVGARSTLQADTRSRRSLKLNRSGKRPSLQTGACARSSQRPAQGR